MQRTYTLASNSLVVVNQSSQPPPQLFNPQIMAYTIKGLAKANECETHDMYGLASLWSYWLACNCNDRQSINDFKRLRKADRQQMLNYLASDAAWADIHTHICANLF